MAKIRKPVTFASHFKIDASTLESKGVLNPILNVDIALFIDPLLLRKSVHPEIKKDATKRFREHFKEVIELLKSSPKHSRYLRRGAISLMKFPEISTTCLGYGVASIRGKGIGGKLASPLLRTAKKIVDLGIEDPDLLMLLPLLEKNIGPDRISDMTTNIILIELMRFTERILSDFELELTDFEYKGEEFRLPIPFVENKKLTPVILVPRDILRELPIASDWSEVEEAIQHNKRLRQDVNQHIGSIWKAKSGYDKDELRKRVLKSKKAVKAVKVLLKAINSLGSTSYNFNEDPSGILIWRQALETVAKNHPMKIRKVAKLNVKEVFKVASKIVKQYKFLIEDRQLAQLLWYKDEPRREKVAQLLFFAVAVSYCKANKLDIITPEVDTDTGEVDFKFSQGCKNRVLVEIKLSKNSRLIAGYEKQLEIYKQSKGTAKALYVVIDVGKIGKKEEELRKLKNEKRRQGDPYSEVVFIDGSIKPAAIAINSGVASFILTVEQAREQEVKLDVRRLTFSKEKLKWLTE